MGRLDVGTVPNRRVEQTGPEGRMKRGWVLVVGDGHQPRERTVQMIQKSGK